MIKFFPAPLIQGQTANYCWRQIPSNFLTHGPCDTLQQPDVTSFVYSYTYIIRVHHYGI